MDSGQQQEAKTDAGWDGTGSSTGEAAAEEGRRSGEGEEEAQPRGGSQSEQPHSESERTLAASKRLPKDFTIIKREATDVLQKIITEIRAGTVIQGLQNALSPNEYQDLFASIKESLAPVLNHLEVLCCCPDTAMYIELSMVLLSRIDARTLGSDNRPLLGGQMTKFVVDMENALRKASKEGGVVYAELHVATKHVSELLSLIRKYLEAQTDERREFITRGIADCRERLRNFYSSSSARLKAVAKSFEVIIKKLQQMVEDVHGATESEGGNRSGSGRSAMAAQSAVDADSETLAKFDERLKALEKDFFEIPEKIKSLRRNAEELESKAAQQRADQEKQEEAAKAEEARQLQQIAERFVSERRTKTNEHKNAMSTLQVTLQTCKVTESGLDARIKKAVEANKDARLPQRKCVRNPQMHELVEAARECWHKMQYSTFSPYLCLNQLKDAYNAYVQHQSTQPASTDRLEEQTFRTTYLDTMAFLEAYGNGQFRQRSLFGMAQKFLVGGQETDNENVERLNACEKLSNVMSAYDEEMEKVEKSARTEFDKAVNGFNKAQMKNEKEIEELRSLLDEARREADRTRGRIAQENASQQTAMSKSADEEKSAIGLTERKHSTDRELREKTNQILNFKLQQKLQENQTELDRLRGKKVGIAEQIDSVRHDKFEAREHQAEQQRNLGELNLLIADSDEIISWIDQILVRTGAAQSELSQVGSLLDKLVSAADVTLQNALEAFTRAHQDVENVMSSPREVENLKRELDEVLRSAFELLGTLHVILNVVLDFDTVFNKYALPTVSGAVGYLGLTAQEAEEKKNNFESKMRQIHKEVRLMLEEEKQKEKHPGDQRRHLQN